MGIRTLEYKLFDGSEFFVIGKYLGNRIKSKMTWILRRLDPKYLEEQAALNFEEGHYLKGITYRVCIILEAITPVAIAFAADTALDKIPYNLSNLDIFTHVKASLYQYILPALVSSSIIQARAKSQYPKEKKTILIHHPIKISNPHSLNY